MDAAEELDRLIDLFAPEVAARAHASLATLRQRLPGVVELGYDNYSALAVALSSTDERRDIICSVTLYPRWVSLFFPHGADMDDPDGILQGSGVRVRHVVLVDDTILDLPAVQGFITASLLRSTVPLSGVEERRAVIKSIAKTRRPRRPV